MFAHTTSGASTSTKGHVNAGRRQSLTMMNARTTASGNARLCDLTTVLPRATNSAASDQKSIRDGGTPSRSMTTASSVEPKVTEAAQSRTTAAYPPSDQAV